MKGRPPSKHGLHGPCSMPRAHAGLITLTQLMVRAEGATVHTLPFASSSTGRSEEPTRSSCRLSTGQYTGRLALKSMHPPCRQCLPHQACSNSDEIWGEACSLGQQHDEGRVAGAAPGRWAHQAFNVSSTI